MKTLYSRKLVSLVLALFLAVSGICTGCARKTEPDCTVAFVLRGSYPEQFTQTIADHLEQYAVDVNGDGEVLVQYVSFFPADPTSLISEFGYADSMLFITDAAPLEQYTDNFIDFFIPITEDGDTAITWGETPALAALDWNLHAINVQGLDVAPEQLEAWCDALQLSCRVIEGTKFEKDKTKVMQHQGATALLRAVQE